MERFKVVERETKTKAYSKEGKILCKLKLNGYGDVVSLCIY